MNALQHGLILAARVYQWVISPAKSALLGPVGRCRFSPTCSQYAIDAVRAHGAVRGSALAGWRLCRCHPWGGFGHDPVPPTGSEFQFPKFRPDDASDPADATAGPALNCSHGS